MSLAWLEPATPVTDIYLGRRLAVVARARQASVLVRYAPTLPLERVLAMLYQSAAALLNESHALRVRLGAAFCPPVNFPVPRHITRWRELHTWARQCAAEALDTDLAQIMVDSDRLHQGLAAALPRAVHDALQTWAVSHRLVIRSLCPLWSDATRCWQARRAHDLWVLEPDGLVRLPAPSLAPLPGLPPDRSHDRWPAATYEPAEDGAATTPVAATTATAAEESLRKLLDARPSAGTVTALVFSPQAAAKRCTKGPSFLAMHWEARHAP